MGIGHTIDACDNQDIKNMVLCNKELVDSEESYLRVSLGKQLTWGYVFFNKIVTLMTMNILLYL